MSFKQENGITDTTDNQDFLNKVNIHLGGAFVHDYALKEYEIRFLIDRKEIDRFYESEILVAGIEILHFRNNDGMIRKGLHQVKRLEIDTKRKKVEVIKEIRNYKHNLSNKTGIELEFQSGKILQMVGTDLVFQIEDGNEIETEFE
ncbi:MAG: hypothetical protein INQ03_01165 [Candidatus Heimdallarchaeota archaeon]|nr:hypothetical protein [Candidatus Heimdallarchaeota archaeon]